MIEAIANPNAGRSAEPSAQNPDLRDDIAAGFSFATAVTALEGRASQSLKTFGAAPQDDGVANPSNASGETSSAPKLANTESQPPERGGNETSVNSSLRTLQAADEGSAPPLAPNSRTAPNATAPGAPLAAIAATAPLQPITPTAARQESSAVREASLARATAAKTPPTSPLRAPQAAPQEFAKLLARRLDNGATSFELRLDPPELGRVEAHLKLGTDGESVLALTFENQTALDHFARDEAGLRAMLFASGFDLGGDRLSFSLKEEAPALPAAGALAVTDTYDPVFIAPFSNGVVDLRI